MSEAKWRRHMFLTSIINFLWKGDMRGRDIREIRQEQYGESCMSRFSVFEWC
jgi:hypothetical protein